jgi:zinc transport system permease protein
MFEFLSYPFMQRAFLAGILLGGLLAYLGVFVVLKRMSFFSDGIAHASLSGVALGVLLSVNPMVVALLAAVLFAFVLFFLEKKAALSSDTAIGLVFTSGMAIGVLLLSLKSGYQPELISFLFGNILTIRPFDLMLIVILGTAVLVFLIVWRRRIALLVFDREMAYLAGINPDLLQLALYIVLSVSIVLAIKILGIILVSALLIIPVSIAKLVSRSFRKLIIVSVVLSEVIVLTGLALSYWFDLPAGAVIVLTGMLIFTAVFIWKKIGRT